jgi:hypothetical protein
MAEKKIKKVIIKTAPTAVSVTSYLENLPDAKLREDSRILLQMMEEATGAKAVLWGAALIGFGNRPVTSAATGRTVDWMKVGFAPRKSKFSLYLMLDLKKHASLLEKLGKHKTGVGCIYINKLADVDMRVLRELVEIAAAGK